MKNINYTSEIASAYQFIINHSYDEELKAFVNEMKHNTDGWLHSDRWSVIYDWMQEHYPGTAGSIITGICYYCER